MHYKTKFRGFKVRKGLVSKIHNWGARGAEPTHIYTHFLQASSTTTSQLRTYRHSCSHGGIPELELTAVHHWSNT